jgi:hypothetical protein
MNEQLELWIKWEGGVCPVNPETIVDVEFDQGTKVAGVAGRFNWTHYPDNGGNIVAYREVV